MKHVLRTLLAVWVLLPGQGAAGDLPGRLDTVYANLVRHDTRMFPADEWSVNDVRIMREILYQVRNSSRLPADALRGIPDEAERVEVICRKRIVDDEIQTVLLTYPSAAGRDSVVLDDFVLVRSVLGDPLYSTVRAYRGTGKDDFETDPARVTDLFLHPLRPSFQLWSTQPSGAPSYLAVAMFGRLGNDMLDLPFWFRGTMVGGLSFTAIDRPSAVRDPEYALFRVRVGIEEPMNFSVPQPSPPSRNSVFKTRKLQGSGTAVFLSGTYAPWTQVPFLGIDTAGFVQLRLDVTLAVEEKERFSPRLPETFSSVRNAVTFLAEVKRLGIFNAGLGISWHDIHDFSRVALPDNQAVRLGSPASNVLGAFELGIAQDGGAVQYDIRTAVHYSFSMGYGFFVVKPLLMVSNLVGIEVSYFKAFRTARLPDWHYDSYLVFAPVLRINF